MEPTWDVIQKENERKRIDALKALSLESWITIIRNVISGIIFIEKPNEWEGKWVEVFSRIKEQNSLTASPLPEEDISMMFITMAGEKKDQMKDQEENGDEGIIRKEFIKNKTKGTYELAKYLTRKYDIITIGEKEREMYVYRNGLYSRAENEIIYPEIQRVLGEHTNKNAKTETFHKIADMTSKPRSVFQIAPLNLIPLSNGVYDMTNKILLSHSPLYRFTYQFPTVFDENAQCPKVKDFLKDILPKDSITIIQEWMGYYFYRLYSFKKSIIFVGEGDTGKTTLMETIINLLGKNNISSVSLHKMSSDKFAAAHLYEKHGNLVDELSARDISDTGSFKIATGGGSISGEYKFGNQFSFLNFSKFTFACNKIPDVKDFDDEAYFGRWIPIHFKNVIQKKIPNFIDTLTSEEERSGLFNFAMRGLERLLVQKSFSHRLTPIEIKIEMMKSGSSIAMFCSEGIHEDIGGEIGKSEMYEAYSNFCRSKRLSTETMDMFGKKFLFYVHYATDGLITGFDKKGKVNRVRGWRNVKVVKKDENDENLDNF